MNRLAWKPQTQMVGRDMGGPPDIVIGAMLVGIVGIPALLVYLVWRKHSKEASE